MSDKFPAGLTVKEDNVGVFNRETEIGWNCEVWNCYAVDVHVAGIG